MTDEERVQACQAEIRRLRGVVRELEAELREFSNPENNTRNLWRLLTEMLPSEPRSTNVDNDPGFWTDGDKILCPSEFENEVLANFLEDVLREVSTATVVTGSYDRKEDEESGMVDNHTGFYYVTIE